MLNESKILDSYKRSRKHHPAVTSGKKLAATGRKRMKITERVNGSVSRSKYDMSNYLS